MFELQTMIDFTILAVIFVLYFVGPVSLCLWSSFARFRNHLFIQFLHDFCLLKASYHLNIRAECNLLFFRVENCSHTC